MTVKRRLVEMIADESYLEGLSQKPLEAVRAMRDECREGEMELSFERRLCQGRSDILSAELDRRSGAVEGDLLSRLPAILANESNRGDSGLPSRAPDFSIPRNADIPRRRVEEIVGEQTLTRLPSLSTEEIKQIMRSLSEYEQGVSARRKAVQDVMDKVQAEIVRRYTSGEADPRSVQAG
jgi:hypothetical protein